MPCTTCGTPCVLRTANTANNRGRKFYSCSSQECNFFMYVQLYLITILICFRRSFNLGSYKSIWPPLLLFHTSSSLLFTLSFYNSLFLYSWMGETAITMLASSIVLYKDVQLWGIKLVFSACYDRCIIRCEHKQLSRCALLK